MRMAYDFTSAWSFWGKKDIGEKILRELKELGIEAVNVTPIHISLLFERSLTLEEEKRLKDYVERLVGHKVVLQDKRKIRKTIWEVLRKKE